MWLLSARKIQICIVTHSYSRIWIWIVKSKLPANPSKDLWRRPNWKSGRRFRGRIVAFRSDSNSKSGSRNEFVRPSSVGLVSLRTPIYAKWRYDLPHGSRARSPTRISYCFGWKSESQRSGIHNVDGSMNRWRLYTHVSHDGSKVKSTIGRLRVIR